MKTAPQPRKSPRQSRSRATVEAILEATARILDTGGRDAVTTNAIAEAAGVSIGSLYQYFPSREAIFAQMIRTMRAGMHDDLTRARARAEAGTPDEAVEILVAASLRHHLARPGLAEALEDIERSLPLDAETERFKRAIAENVIAVLARHGIADPATTAFDLVAMAHGIASASVAAGQRDFNALHARISRAARGYLAAG